MIRTMIRAQLWFEASCHGAGHALDLLLRSVCLIPRMGKRWKETLHQTSIAIFGAMPVVFLTALFTGMILGLQAGLTLREFNQESAIGFLVSASMCREMGPIFTALPIAGLIGSTYAAELGTMKISEEIDALEVMSIDPVHFLVLPRIVALSVTCATLTIFADIIGILGGGLVGQAILNVDFDLYMKNAREALKLRDVYGGIFKAFIFGLVIASVACSQGLRAEHGAQGVGKATMKAVVISFVLVLLFDYILSWMIY